MTRYQLKIIPVPLNPKDILVQLVHSQMQEPSILGGPPLKLDVILNKLGQLLGRNPTTNVLIQVSRLIAPFLAQLPAKTPQDALDMIQQLEKALWWVLGSPGNSAPIWPSLFRVGLRPNRHSPVQPHYLIQGTAKPYHLLPEYSFTSTTDANGNTSNFISVQSGQRTKSYAIAGSLYTDQTGKENDGHVVSAVKTRTEEFAAIKFYPFSPTDPYWIAELENWQSLPPHPNLVPLNSVGLIRDGRNWLVGFKMPLVWGQNLEDFTETQAIEPENHRNGGLQQYLTYARDIALGLWSIHQSKKVYVDLKPANVLVSEAGATLCDFAKTTDTYDNFMFPSVPGYIPPELLVMDNELQEFNQAKDAGSMRQDELFLWEVRLLNDYARPTAAIDIFMFGVLLVDILTGFIPYDRFVSGPDDDQGWENYRTQVCSSYYQNFHGLNGNTFFRLCHTHLEASRVPESVQAIIQACLQLDPGRRPSALEIVNRLNTLLTQLA